MIDITLPVGQDYLGQIKDSIVFHAYSAVQVNPGNVIEFIEPNLGDRVEATALAVTDAGNGFSIVSCIATGYAILPTKLTAENGAKAALIGEFEECIEDPRVDPRQSACIRIPIQWTTIKDIWSKAVDHFKSKDS